MIIWMVPVICSLALAAELAYPPRMTGDQEVHTGTGPLLLQAPPYVKLKEGVKVARTAPTIDAAFYPNQDAADFWSNWGDGVAVDGKYYSSFGNHKGLDGRAFACEWDEKTRKLRTLCDVRKLLGRPEGDYLPGKIHGRLDMAADGWLYFGTARGQTSVTTDKAHYQGDWIIRTNPADGRSEVVAQGPAGKATLLAAVTDGQRMIFYGGTVVCDMEKKSDNVGFFAYDLKRRKLLFSLVGDGCYKYMILARSTGRVYYAGHTSGCLYRYDPATPDKKPVVIAGKVDAKAARRKAYGGDAAQDGVIPVRSATQETADGLVYTISAPEDGPTIWRFNTKTERAEPVGVAAVGSETYVTSIDIDPTGRYLYYTLGAHTGAQKDGSPVVQFDLKTKSPKILAFLRPYCEKNFGFMPKGSYSCAVSPDGGTVYVTWHGTRNLAAGSKATLDTCALTIIRIPASER